MAIVVTSGSVRQLLEGRPSAPGGSVRPQHDPTEGVGGPRRRVTDTGVQHLVDEAGVGRGEHVDRRPLEDALGELPGRPEVEGDLDAVLVLEPLAEPLERRPQVRGGRDHEVLAPRRGVLAWFAGAGRHGDHQGEHERADRRRPHREPPRHRGGWPPHAAPARS
jgi:hypothetical protein